MTVIRFGRPKLNVALDYATNPTTASVVREANGLLSAILIKTPATVDSSATVTVNLLDADGYTIYSKSAVAANTRSVNVLSGDTKVPLAGDITVQVVFSANQTANRTTEVVLLVDRG